MMAPAFSEQARVALAAEAPISPLLLIHLVTCYSVTYRFIDRQRLDEHSRGDRFLVNKSLLGNTTIHENSRRVFREVRPEAVLYNSE
jgi:hypothetical protein